MTTPAIEQSVEQSSQTLPSPSLEWVKRGSYWLGMRGARVFCGIEHHNDLGCYGLQEWPGGLFMFTTFEAAQAAAELRCRGVV